MFHLIALYDYLQRKSVKRAVETYITNSEKEKKKDEIKNERLRMQKLMQEDEEGYRQLLDEKKVCLLQIEFFLHCV